MVNQGYKCRTLSYWSGFIYSYCDIGRFKLKDLYSIDINEELLDEEIELSGWVQVKREHGGIIFIDLRDRSGIVQLVFDQNESMDLFNLANELKSEYVIKVKGKVRKRENPNPNIPTGYYEVLVLSLEVLNEAKPLPIQVIKQTEDSEEIRLKYRYIDLRRERMKENIVARHKVTSEIRKFFNDRGFYDIETPFLTKSTPEGARDFLVPSRLNQGRFYALPQSPQIFKQLLMISGFEKYYQIVRCFRDEDLRADRQPEFTQLDVEMSFIDEEDIFSNIDEMFKSILGSVYGKDLSTPLPRMKYDEAMSRYGTDRPDLRFGLALNDVSDFIKKMKVKSFLIDGINQGRKFYTLVSPLSDKITRKFLDSYASESKKRGCDIFTWAKINGVNKSISGPFSKLFENTDDILGIVGALSQIDYEKEENYILFGCYGEERKVQELLGDLRSSLGDLLGLINNEDLNFCWVTDFPLFEWSDEEGKIVSVHHPFTSPKSNIEEVEIELRSDNIYKLKSRSYDLVLNGIELGGGSIRIHKPKVQRKVFSILGLSHEEIDQKFGFLIRALEYGAPPHGGIAFGLDRIVMMLQGESSIREVIPFPKTASGLCPLTGAPDFISARQLGELGLKLK